MYWLKQIYYGLLGICLIALLFHHKKLDKGIFFFITILSLAIITQVIGDVIKSNGSSHYFVFHIYIPVEYLFLSLYYRETLKGKWLQRVILLSGLLFLVFCVQYYVMNKDRFYQPDFSQFVIEALLVSIWVIIFFTQLFQSEEKIVLASYPSFWINTANLVFYSGCLFVMGMHFSLLQKNPALAEKLLKINHYLNLILYLLYIIAFTCLRTSKK